VGHKYDGMSRLEFIAAICKQYGRVGLRADDVLRDVDERKVVDSATYASRIHDLMEAHEISVTPPVAPTPPDKRYSSDLFKPYHSGLF